MIFIYFLKIFETNWQPSFYWQKVSALKELKKILQCFSRWLYRPSIAVQWLINNEWAYTNCIMHAAHSQPFKIGRTAIVWKKTKFQSLDKIIGHLWTSVSTAWHSANMEGWLFTLFFSLFLSEKMFSCIGRKWHMAIRVEMGLISRSFLAKLGGLATLHIYCY